MEVDTGTESPPVLAAEFDRYRRFFRRTLYAPAGREGHPPGAGPRTLVTPLTPLRTHGPYGPIWWRYGPADHHQRLEAALGNPNGNSAYYDRDDRRHQAERARQRAEEAERERRRPACAQCGEEFTDTPWSTIENWRNAPYPKLCEDCPPARRGRRSGRR
ncbi:hypothetical protein [Streptomyces mayteni]